MSPCDESGQGMVEYGLVAAFILIVVMAIFVAMGPEINRMFQESANAQAIGDGQVTLDAASDTT